MLSQNTEAAAVVIIEVTQTKEKSLILLFSISKKTSILSEQFLFSSAFLTENSCISNLFGGFLL
jgi:hypothetical protein